MGRIRGGQRYFKSNVEELSDDSLFKKSNGDEACNAE